MKTLKQTLKTTTYFLFAIIVTLSFSCSPEDGKDGQDGAQGEQGIAGQDGNANVSTYTINFPTANQNSFGLPFPELTQDVLDNDVIITYFSYGNGIYYHVPGIANNYLIETELIPGAINIYFYSRQGGNNTNISTTPDIFLKTIIIESNTASRSYEPNTIYDQLENANLDITDYFAVCDYFGIDY